MIALDTSVIVAALLSWHEHHARAARALERALGSKGGVLLPLAVLIETYAVLTRLPPPHRLAPRDAFELLRANFAGVKSASLSARAGFPLLQSIARRDLGGGLTYDAVILETARDARANALLTMNARDFERLDEDIEIRTP